MTTFSNSNQYNTYSRMRKAAGVPQPWNIDDSYYKAALSTLADSGVAEDKVNIANAEIERQNQAYIEAQKDAIASQEAAGLAKEGMNIVGKAGIDYLKNGDASYVSKGIDAAKGLYDKILGPSVPSETPAISGMDPSTFTMLTTTEPISGMGPQTYSLAGETVTPLAGEVAAPTAEAGAELAASAMADSGLAYSAPIAAEAGGATLGSIMGGAAAAGPWAAIGAIAAKLGGMGLESLGGGPDSSNVVAQAGRTIQDILNPIGWGIKKIGGACIIVTACTNRNSYEVNVTRQYRDRFLDSDQRRGYYYWAEKIVPILERNEMAKAKCKKYLVDRLIDYGEYKLGRNRKPRVMSYVISKLFLATIKITGYFLPCYVRQNGEVY